VLVLNAVDGYTKSKPDAGFMSGYERVHSVLNESKKKVQDISGRKK